MPVVSSEIAIVYSAEVSDWDNRQRTSLDRSPRQDTRKLRRNDVLPQRSLARKLMRCISKFQATESIALA